jgi:hypothetical protein
MRAGVHSYYEVTGDGEPLLLLHGGMCTAETLDGQTLNTECSAPHGKSSPAPV